MTKSLPTSDKLKNEYHLVLLQNVLNEIPEPSIDLFFQQQNKEKNKVAIKKSNIFMENLKLFLDRLSPEIGYCIITTRGRQNHYLADRIKDYFTEEDSFHYIFNNQKASLITPIDEDQKIKKHIYEGHLPWDYRSRENSPKVFVIKKL